MPTFPEWWNWDLSFTSHAELRMEQRLLELGEAPLAERITVAFLLPRAAD